jgi:hypothetical protein
MKSHQVNSVIGEIEDFLLGLGPMPAFFSDELRVFDRTWDLLFEVTIILRYDSEPYLKVLSLRRIYF